MSGQTKNNAGIRGTRKNSEERKIFVGRIPYEATNADLVSYFQQFGEVLSAMVMYDRFTHKSRGFAFVEFKTLDGYRAALANREQQYNNKTIKVKPANSQKNKEVGEPPIVKTKKVIVEGLSVDITMADICACFEPYGPIEKIEWPFSKFTKKRCNFAFIVFNEERFADLASAKPHQMVGSRECDVKKATVQQRSRPGNPGSVPDGPGYMGHHSHHYPAHRQHVEPQVSNPCGGVPAPDAPPSVSGFQHCLSALPEMSKIDMDELTKDFEAAIKRASESDEFFTPSPEFLRTIKRCDEGDRAMKRIMTRMKTIVENCENNKKK